MARFEITFRVNTVSWVVDTMLCARSYLIHVHVALGTTTGLEDDQREVIDQLP